MVAGRICLEVENGEPGLTSALWARNTCRVLRHRDTETHTQTHRHRDTRTQTLTLICTLAPTFVYVFIHTHVHTYLQPTYNLHTHTHTHAYIYIYACSYRCVCGCVKVYFNDPAAQSPKLTVTDNPVIWNSQLDNDPRHYTMCGVGIEC